MHEHPHDDSSWETPGILELLEQDAVERARGAICRWGAMPGAQGIPPSGMLGLIRWRTGIMTNMPELANALELKKGCPGDFGPEQHPNVLLTSGVARKA